MDKKQIEMIVRGIIAFRVPKAPHDKITLDTELAKLGIDSVAFSWMLADIEDTFGFVMTGSDIMKLKTLDDAVKFVAAHLKKK